MSNETWVFLILSIIGLVALAFLWAGGIADEPPATAAERRCWPGDVVEDNGEYNGEYDD